MKAWTAENLEGHAVLVFANTRGQAKALLRGCDEFDGYEFIEISVYRCSQADKMYRGEYRMDWNNEQERMFLVKELGWRCIDPDTKMCETCIAREHCCDKTDMETIYD